MIKKNEEYIVDIIDNGFQGEGIAKIDGMTVFIDNAIKGEKVKIKILKVLKTQAYGKVQEIIKTSRNRNELDCETFNKCGGCNLRHIKYEETLNMKKSIVENKPTMGIFAKMSHRIISTNNCNIQNKLTQKIAGSVFEFILENNIPVYDEEQQKGELRHIYVRIGVKTNEVMLVLITNKPKITREKELVNFITSKYPEIKTVVKNINSKNTNVILGKENITLYGNGYIEDELLGFRFKISPMSFYQVNPTQTEILYTKAIEGAELTGKETIFDLYCGIGTIGICASKYVQKIYGIETVPEAIEDAKENAKINKIENAEFIVGNVEDVLPEFVRKNKTKPDAVFIDPPRKGCDKKVIETLLEVEPQKIVYISCNPATLARDLKMLEVKYEIKEVTPVDMFPYTSHVECVAVMGIKDNL